MLRAEQDREYREAEETDRREREKREAEALEKRLAEAAAKQAQELQEAIELSKRLSHEATVNETKGSLKPEPADGPDSATIRFMLPKSSKVTRRFHRGDTVGYLNDFLVVHFYEAGTGVTHFSLSTHSKQELTDMNSTLESVVCMYND